MTRRAPVRVMPHTDWIRYRIHSRSATGKDKWIYAPGVAECGEEAICEHIVGEYEAWARHAERISIDYFTAELPPAEIILGQLKRYMQERRQILEHVRDLGAQLEKAKP